MKATPRATSASLPRPCASRVCSSTTSSSPTFKLLWLVTRCARRRTRAAQRVALTLTLSPPDFGCQKQSQPSGSFQRRDDGTASTARRMWRGQRRRGFNCVSHNGGRSVVVACYRLQVSPPPAATTMVNVNLSLRVPSKFAESVMLSAFQSRTGQKFPRTPLPVFEVVQELRKVEACVFIACDNCIQRANFLVQVYITRYSKRTDPVASVALVGATSTALPSFAVIAILFPNVQPFASRRCVVACCLDTSFRISRACLQKRGMGSPANREAHAGRNVLTMFLAPLREWENTRVNANDVFVCVFVQFTGTG